MPASPSLPLLQKLPLFANLSELELTELVQQTRLDYFSPDDLVFRQGDPCNRIWLLRSGRIKIVYQEESGREVILETISPGELFGGAALFMPQHPATAQVMIASETVSFSTDAYQQLLSKYPILTFKLIRMLGQRLHSLMSLQILAGERVERRLAHILLKLAERTGRPDNAGILITIPLSRQDLADMSGTTLETAIRTISRFRSDELIQTLRGGYLLILNKNKLQEIAHGADNK